VISPSLSFQSVVSCCIMDFFVPEDEEVVTKEVPNDPDDRDEKDYYGYDDLDPKSEISDDVNRSKHGRRINVTAEVAPHDLLTFRPSRVLFYAPPRQRQRWGDTQVLPRVNWGDLFFDLFYVGATYNVSSIMLESPNRRGFLYAAGTFLPVMNIWNQKVFYDARYVIEADVVHRVLTIVGLAITGVAISNIRPVEVLADASNQSNIFVFTLMLVVEQLFAICLYLEVYFRGIGQRQVKMAARRDILYNHLYLPFYMAAMIISAVSYFGDGSQLNYTFNSSSSRRFLAAASDPVQGTTGYTDIPIFLCLFGVLVYMFSFASSIIFCIPGGGRHKEL
jgi:Bacterial low temperature requirement A protein (LtrA)